MQWKGLASDLGVWYSSWIEESQANHLLPKKSLISVLKWKIGIVVGTPSLIVEMST